MVGSLDSDKSNSGLLEVVGLFKIQNHYIDVVTTFESIMLENEGLGAFEGIYHELCCDLINSTKKMVPMYGIRALLCDLPFWPLVGILSPEKDTLMGLSQLSTFLSLLH